MQIVTVPGGTGVTIAIPFTSESNQLAAQQLLQALYYANPQQVHIAYADTGFDSAVPGDINELVDSVAGQVAVPSGYQYLIADYVTAASNPYPANSFVGYGDFDGSSIDASADGLSYTAGTGTVTIVAGGAVTFNTLASNGGNGTLLLDGGLACNVDLASGNWSVQTAYGPTNLTLGSGADTVTVLGQGTIHGGDALATVSLESADGVYYGGQRAQTIVDKGGNDSVVAGAGWDTVFAQGTGLHVQGGSGQTTFVDLTGRNTFVAGSGGAVAFGSAVGSTYQAGTSYFILVNTGGNDTVNAPLGTVGPVIFGSPNGVIHLDSAAQGAFVVAGSGDETINASASPAGITFFGGDGPSDLIGGADNNYFCASTGNCTMSAAGGGDLYEFIDHYAGARYVISDFHTTDNVYLSGYGTAPNSGIETEIVTNGTLAMTLSDGTQIVFQNVGSASDLAGKIHNV